MINLNQKCIEQSDTKLYENIYVQSWGHLLAVPEKVYTTGDDQQVNGVISNDTQGITVFISNYRVFLHGKNHIC